MSETRETRKAARALTDEHLRILIAIDEGRMKVNQHGRYEIEDEERPDRKSREQLRSRGLIAHFYERGRSSHWRLTAKGRLKLSDEMRQRVAVRRREVDRLVADGVPFAEAWERACHA